jgi:hypothetical protein
MPLLPSRDTTQAAFCTLAVALLTESSPCCCSLAITAMPTALLFSAVYSVQQRSSVSAVKVVVHYYARCRHGTSDSQT